jgi:hypothetical protein
MTGKLVKSILTDGGTEFDGEFTVFCEGRGIIKKRGAPYAEKANETVNTASKALMLSSKYYPLAQAFAAYLHNRTVHAGQTRTPYEIIYGTKPDLSNLHKFGCLGFAFIPHEKRSKLEPVRERCRLVGYGDDDDTEETKGFLVLAESDLSLIYVSDVLFEDSAEIEEVQLLEPWNPEINIFSYPIENVPDTNYMSFESETDFSTSTAQETSASALSQSQAPSQIEYDDSEDERQDGIYNDVMSRQHLWEGGTSNNVVQNTETLTTFRQAVTCNEKDLWITAMRKEVEASEEDEVFFHSETVDSRVKSDIRELIGPFRARV